VCAAGATGADAPRHVASHEGTGFAGAGWGDPVADLLALTSSGRNDPSADPGSLYTIERSIGARSVWAQKDSLNRQITGQGVTVALLDSGTAGVAGLNGTGKLTYGPDLSIESNGVLTDQDTYGHGTHLAGIIAGRDAATLNATTIPTLSPSVQLGVAPDANLLSIKLATTDGSTDVSEVIAALDWVTQHQTNADGSKIRVVNLSFGTQSVQAYQLDPLAAAAENAWKHGLTVVVSGGNQGTSAGRLDDPAIDPYVIAVGSSDSHENILGWTSPGVAPYSSSGTTSRHVDLLAPGTSVVSLRDPGSYVDVNHPEGRVTGDSSGRFFRGSGTSQAAAVVSGAAALLLQAYPKLTPDQVKAALVSTAAPVAASPVYAGAGEINVASALTKAGQLANPNLLTNTINSLTSPPVTQSFPASTGQGSIEAARAGNDLVDTNGFPLSGEVDLQGNPWNPKAWWAAASTATAWSGGSWMGSVWTGASWATGTGLTAARWSAARWSAARWSSSSWSAARWSAARWSAARWSDASWG